MPLMRLRSSGITLQSFNEAAGADPADALGAGNGYLLSKLSFNEAAGADPADASR